LRKAGVAEEPDDERSRLCAAIADRASDIGACRHEEADVGRGSATGDREWGRGGLKRDTREELVGEAEGAPLGHVEVAARRETLDGVVPGAADLHATHEAARRRVEDD